MRKEFLLRSRQLVFTMPPPLRFLSVGGIGLVTDLSTFTILNIILRQVFISRALSLLIATFVTWQINRIVTFASSGRRLHDEIVRYLTVTLVAQGISYATFSILILTKAMALPLMALITGAAVAAVFSYNGHRLFSFARRGSDPSEKNGGTRQTDRGNANG